MAIFMVTSLLIRPIAGKLSDETLKKPLMMFGIVLFAIASTSYLLVPTTQWSFLAVRMLQGAGFAFFYTVSSSYLTQTVPEESKAEGISYHSNAVKLAIAFSPMIALFLVEQGSFDWLFLVSGVLGILAIILTSRLKPLSIDSSTRVNAGKYFNRKAVFPGLLIASNSIVFGAIIPFVPLLAKQNALPNPWPFYGIYAAALISTRFFSGQLSDRFGRQWVILPGMLMVIISLVVMSDASSQWSLLLSALLYGLGAGVVQPSLIALVADRTLRNERGSAMATFTMFTDFGVASGSFLTATLGELFGYGLPLLIVAGVCGVGCLLYGLKLRFPEHVRFKEEKYPTEEACRNFTGDGSFYFQLPKKPFVL